MEWLARLSKCPPDIKHTLVFSFLSSFVFLFLCRYILKDALSVDYHLRLSLIVSIIIISALFFKHAQPIHHSSPFILRSSLHFLHWFTINMCESEEERRKERPGEKEGRSQAQHPLPPVRIGALVQNEDQKATNDRRVTNTYLQCTLARNFAHFWTFWTKSWPQKEECCTIPNSGLCHKVGGNNSWFYCVQT